MQTTTTETAAAEAPPPIKTFRDHALDIQLEGMRCNCDLDNWEPERSTGHSHVCRIHDAAVARFYAAFGRRA